MFQGRTSRLLLLAAACVGAAGCQVQVPLPAGLAAPHAQPVPSTTVSTEPIPAEPIPTEPMPSEPMPSDTLPGEVGAPGLGLAHDPWIAGAGDSAKGDRGVGPGAVPSPVATSPADMLWGDGLGDVPVLPDVEAGAYAQDPRWPAFVRAWNERVTAAFERLGVVTGLTFAKTGRPRVVLRPFLDETRTHELRAEIRAGLRRAVVHVNAEPLMAGTHDADRVLLRALAEAAFDDASRRQGAVPRWFVRMAASAASGDVAERLLALRRQAETEEGSVLHVDPADVHAAEATGLAALLLLASRGQPQDVRRAVLFVADGDDADRVVARLTRAVNGGWASSARLALGAGLADIDPAPWRLLATAQLTATETGRAGLEALLSDGAPAEVADEIAVLRARTALAEGDAEGARQALAAVAPDAARRLAEPAAAVVLRIELESRAGGDARVARRLAAQLDLDYPRSEARRNVRSQHPMLGMEEDPQRWLGTMHDRVAAEGVAELGLRTIEQY
ncbi:MAG: hypothetical protein O2894_14245, partial [Planctomycetota bacterium]|nr:hypothetical protein [Planctomycetota bacterium]